MENKNTIKAQKLKILEYLKTGEFINTEIALALFGCFALGSRIADLRKMGYNIRTERVYIKRYTTRAKYFLEDGKDKQ